MAANPTYKITYELESKDDLPYTVWNYRITSALTGWIPVQHCESYDRALNYIAVLVQAAAKTKYFDSEGNLIDGR